MFQTELGANFSDNTAMTIRKPDNLEDATVNNIISMWFNMTEGDSGLLLYIGADDESDAEVGEELRSAPIEYL